jgi:hypothetical protein
MSDVELLFVVLAVLYVWECTCWLRRGAVAFSTWLGRGWRAWHPDTLIGNQNGGFILASPLPPLGTLFVASQFPLSISADGVLAFVATNVNPGWRPVQSGRFVRFEDIRETRADGRRLIINGERWAACSSPGLARRCAEHLHQLAKLKPAPRAAAIGESLHGAFDASAVERLRQEYEKRAKRVRGLSNGLLGYAFVVVPAVIWHFGFKLSWLSLLAGLLGLTSATAFFFFRAHRALYPKAGDERFTHTLTILLAPTTAMRAHDALSRPLLENFHPLALAKVLLPEKDFREFAQRLLRDLRHPAWPLCPNENPGAREVEAQARRALQSVAEQFLKENGVGLDALCQPPIPTDDACRAYCPRCHAQFTSTEATCTDCGGLPLVTFEKRNGPKRRT